MLLGLKDTFFRVFPTTTATGTGILCYNLLSFTCDVFDLYFLH